MAKLKVFGGLVFGDQHKQCRAIIATTSQAKAADSVGVSLSHFRGYWSETGNEVELSTALAKPGQVFMERGSRDRDFRPVVRVGHSWNDV